MTFVQQQPVFRRQLVDADEDAVFDGPQTAERLADLGKDPQSLAVAGAWGESVALEIPGQPDSRRNDYVRVLARCVEPARAAVR